MSSSFRLHARNFFLTYPNCGDKSGCFNFLKNKFSDSLSFLLVAKETHESGEPHLHAVVSLTRKWDCRNPRALDFNDFHGDYKAARDLTASVTYCKKDDPEPLVYGEEPGSTKRKWQVARRAETFDSFMDAVADADYKSFVVFHDKIESFARKKFKSDPIVYTDPFPESWLPNTVMDSWAIDNIVNWVPSAAIRPKSLILVGDSRLGKTAWARKHGQHVYFNGTWNMSKLDCISSDTKYAVWDDLYAWESFNYKQWLGGQWEFDVTGKYRAPRTIEGWGRPSIVCCNALPSHLDNQWVRDNCLIVYVRFRLYQ
ncbi:Rep [Trichosanthes kirilowii geminiviridae]|nr:Rep [Trichosanthes kirilowii geminiviridae]